jgi:hypothetical protein
VSIEEDVLMRRVREIVAVLREHELTEDCKKCGTVFAVGLDRCPNCQEPLETDDASQQPADDYDSRNVEQLRAELSKRQMSTTGNKAELISRLRENDATTDSAAPNPFGQ